MAKFKRRNGVSFYHGDVCEAIKKDILELGEQIRKLYVSSKTEKEKFKQALRSYRIGRFSRNQLIDATKEVRARQKQLAEQQQALIIRRGILMDEYHKAYQVVLSLRG